MSAISRSIRSASKLRIQSRSASGLCPASIGAGRFASSGFAAAAASLPAKRNNFSTSSSKLSGAPVMPSTSREYDPEIKDIADYVANKTIDSELAVSVLGCSRGAAVPLIFKHKKLSTPPSDWFLFEPSNGKTKKERGEDKEKKRILERKTKNTEKPNF
jgi:hypothetical protein